MDDLARLLRIARDPARGETFQETVSTLHAELRRVIPGAKAHILVFPKSSVPPPPGEYSLFRPMGRLATEYRFLEEFDGTVLDAYLEHYVQFDAVGSQLLRLGPLKAASARSLVPTGKWGRDPLTGEYATLAGVSDSLQAYVGEVSVDHVASVGLCRGDGEKLFTSREVRILELVLPDVRRAICGAVLREAMAGVRPSGSTLGAGVLVYGEHGLLEHADDQARHLLHATTGTQPGYEVVTAWVQALRATGAATLDITRTIPSQGERWLRLRASASDQTRIVVLVEPVQGGTREYFEAQAARIGLTPREREVSLGVCAGESNKEIAWRLGTSPNTVKRQLVSAFRKAGVAGRGELTALLMGIAT